MNESRTRVLQIGSLLGTVAVLWMGTRGWSQQTTTVTTQQIAGVFVDADGVLRTKLYGDRGGQLSRARIAAQRAALNPQVAVASKLRKVSLPRLERAVEAALAQGQKPTEEMRYLAGITKIQYVFVYPDSGDIVIAGPAEGWATDLSGRVLGMESGRPVIELDDLVVALRGFPPEGPGTDVISCSIDPTQEGLANLQQFLNTLGSRANPGNSQFITTGMRQSLGLQLVNLRGVSKRTHFAQVLVEADYRMKMIGIGLERPPMKLASYVDLASPAAVSNNAMQRWYFVPNYECVKVAEDELGMELVGQGVKLIGADELVATDGSRVKATKVDAAGKKFVQEFTSKYPELAAVVPVYAQLRNLIDLAVAAAFIQKYDYYGQSHWSMETFANEQVYPVETLNGPDRVETAVNAVWKANRLVLPIGGGVRIEPALAMEPSNLLPDEDAQVKRLRGDLGLERLAPERWWWD